MSGNQFKADYKGYVVITSTSHSGSGGPFTAGFSISRPHADSWQMEHQELIEPDFRSEEEARNAAEAEARKWIDKNGVFRCELSSS